MNNSYIKESLDEVKQYLAEKQSVDELLGQTDKVKSIIMGSDYWNDRQKIIGQVLRCNVCINKKNIVEEGEPLANGYQKHKDEVVGYECSIQGGSVIADLCNAFKVDIPQNLTTKFGQKLDSKLKEISDSVNNYSETLSNLQQTLKEAISKTLNIDVNTELSDDQIYQIVSRLPDYEEESKKLLLESYKKTNGVENPDAKLKQPTSDLFKLLEDEKLKTYINEYKKKSLEERKKEPLRQVFRWNYNTKNYDLDKVTQKKTIKEWFEPLIGGTPKEDKAGIYFVLLELFGKDFEFGGNTGYNVPKAKLWTKVDEEEVKNWYKENKIQTDLFDDLEIEKKQNKNNNEEKDNININNIIEEKINNEQNEKINTPEINTSGNNKLRAKGRKGRRERSKTSRTGYTIGLFLDVLATILFVYLGISNPLFFLALIITVPTGIFCGIKLCGCCLSFGDEKITTSYNTNYNPLLDERLTTKQTEQEDVLPSTGTNYDEMNKD